METLGQPESASSDTKPAVDHLPEQDVAAEWRQWRSPAVFSLVVHTVAITALVLMPGALIQPPGPEEEAVHVTTVSESNDLTQTTPNKGPISKEIGLESIAPRPQIKSPSPAPAATQAPPPAPVPAAAPPPPPQAAEATPKPVLVDPPKIQPDPNAKPLPDLAQTVTPPLPTQPPKPTLQDVTPAPAPAQGRAGTSLTVPNPSVQEAVRSLSRGTVPQGVQSVGDLGIDEGGRGLGLNLPPSAGQPRIPSLELRSDAMGVDFRPYLLQVLAAVRKNWFAVFPEAARLGQRGQVTIEFAVGKDGKVNKIVFSGQSGSRPLDQAAVSAISASNPFIPLPVEFRGDRIVLGMTFMYNMPKQ
jgi:TonB family protein